MFKKKIIFCFITLFFFSTFIVSDEIIIISKVNDEIITNIDLEKQIKRKHSPGIGFGQKKLINL